MNQLHGIIDGPHLRKKTSDHFSNETIRKNVSLEHVINEDTEEILAENTFEVTKIENQTQMERTIIEVDESPAKLNAKTVTIDFKSLETTIELNSTL